MTEQEARKIIGGITLDRVSEEETRALGIACKALEKQIAREPFFEGDGYWDGSIVYDTWRCPNCDKAYELEVDEHDYCPNCGQAIKWEWKRNV